MEITVRSSMHISEIFGSSSICVEICEPITLGGLLRELADTYGQEFYSAVCNDSGYPDDKVVIMINGIGAIAKQGIDTQVSDGDEILILPFISGG